MKVHIDNKSKNIKKATTFVLTTSVLMSGVSPIFADGNTSKEEVVYVKLNEDGGVNNIYIVNEFENSKKIVDYGNYSNVLNLSTDDKLNFSNGLLEANISNKDEKFYYQGEIKSKELPWNINIKYYLDGKEITDKELAGKSGKLEIKIDITENKNSNKEFYENYALQIALGMDSTKCKNIVADGATVASVGPTKNITYMKLPGSDASYSLTADVKDFEMDAISINGLNMSMDINIDLDDMTGDLDKLVDAIEAVNDGTGTLKEGLEGYSVGVNELQKGSSKLTSGIKEYKSGVSTLDSGVVGLSSGIGNYKNGVNSIYKSSNELLLGLKEVNTGMKAVEGGVTKLKDGSNEFNQGLQGLSKGASDYKNSLNQYSNSVKGSVDKIKQTLTEEQLQMLQAELITIEKGTNSLAAGYDSIYAGVNNVAKSYGELNNGMNNLHNNISPLSNGITNLYSGMGEFNKGVSQLVSGIDTIDTGAKELKNGSGQLVSGINEINTGANDLNNGTNQLASGIKEINAGVKNLNSGTNELNKETKSMPKEIDKKVDDMTSGILGKDFTPISFASEKNTNIESVQFAMRTEGISKKETKDIKDNKEVKKENPGMWQLFLNLFK